LQNYVKKLPNVAKLSKKLQKGAKLIQNVAKRLKKLQKVAKFCKNLKKKRNKSAVCVPLVVVLYERQGKTL